MLDLCKYMNLLWNAQNDHFVKNCVGQQSNKQFLKAKLQERFYHLQSILWWDLNIEW